MKEITKLESTSISDFGLYMEECPKCGRSFRRIFVHCRTVSFPMALTP